MVYYEPHKNILLIRQNPFSLIMNLKRVVALPNISNQLFIHIVTQFVIDKNGFVPHWYFRIRQEGKIYPYDYFIQVMHQEGMILILKPQTLFSIIRLMLRHKANKPLQVISSRFERVDSPWDLKHEGKCPVIQFPGAQG